MPATYVSDWLLASLRSSLPSPSSDPFAHSDDDAGPKLISCHHNMSRSMIRWSRPNSQILWYNSSCLHRMGVGSNIFFKAALATGRQRSTLSQPATTEYLTASISGRSTFCCSLRRSTVLVWHPFTVRPSFSFYAFHRECSLRALGSSSTIGRDCCDGVGDAVESTHDNCVICSCTVTSCLRWVTRMKFSFPIYQILWFCFISSADGGSQVAVFLFGLTG